MPATSVLEPTPWSGIDTDVWYDMVCDNNKGRTFAELAGDLEIIADQIDATAMAEEAVAGPRVETRELVTV